MSIIVLSITNPGQKISDSVSHLLPCRFRNSGSAGSLLCAPTKNTMEAAASFVCPKVTPFSYAPPKSSNARPLRHFNKQVQSKGLYVKNSIANTSSSLYRTYYRPVGSKLVNPFRIGSGFPSLGSPSNPRIVPLLRTFGCSFSNSATPADPATPTPFLKLLGGFSLDFLKSTLSKLTPADICKWCLAFCTVVAVSKWTVNLLFNPFFWTYFSWTWLFWPLMVAVALAVGGIYCLGKHRKGQATEIEQLVVVTSVFTWLTLVPPAYFNGFLEGWPFVFFFVYHYFFFLNISIRKRLYGDFYVQDHNPKWDLSLPNRDKILFCASVFVGHWLAAFEGVELHLVPGGWNNLPIWCLIILSIFMQYHSTLYLAKYSEKVVVPTAVVQFGPYRFVRHPIYASTMLLFASYLTALRAPLSTLFIIGVCLVYYGKKAKLEEALMLETFGEKYSEYAAKVRFRLIPFVY